jgi:hypothetical protein
LQNYFCQLLNVHGVNVWQTETHIAEPSSFEVEIAIEKMKRYKSPGIDQILAEIIQAQSTILHSENQKLITCIWNKEELSNQWKESIIVHIIEYCSYQLHTKCYPTFFCQG